MGQNSEKHKLNPSESPSPFFIAGCGRSGTTFLRTILDIQDDIFIPRETLCLATYLKYFNYLPKKTFLKLFYNEPEIIEWYSGPKFYSYSLAEIINFIHRTGAKKHGAIVWGQKTPRFIRHFYEFKNLFPNSRWILIYRDPRAVVSSLILTNDHTYSVIQGTKRWLKDNELILELLQLQTLPNEILLVKYEDLITYFQKEMRKITDFLNISSLNLKELEKVSSNTEFNNSTFQNNAIRNGLIPNEKSIKAWKNNLSSSQIKYIEDTCRDEMQLMKYDDQSKDRKKTRKRDLFYFRIARMKDIQIVFAYLLNWPKYLFYTIQREITCRLFAAFNRSLH